MHTANLPNVTTMHGIDDGGVVMQARLDQEADEYAKLMQQHARRAAPAAPGDSKKKKKKKHKKEAPVAPSCAAVEADPIPESIDGDAPGEFEHYDPNDFEKAIGSDEWCAVLCSSHRKRVCAQRVACLHDMRCAW